MLVLLLLPMPHLRMLGSHRRWLVLLWHLALLLTVGRLSRVALRAMLVSRLLCLLGFMLGIIVWDLPPMIGVLIVVLAELP